jgi:hypothetical protein
MRNKNPSGRKHKTPNMSPEQVAEVAALFTNTKMSCAEIGEMYGKTDTGIRLAMKRVGVSRNHIDRRGYTVIDDKFSEPWTEEHSYWLGMMHADGHCSKKGSHVALELKSEDKATVEGFARFVGFTGELRRTEPHKFVSTNGKTYMSSGTWSVRFSSKKIHADLTERGIVSRNKQIWIPPVGLRDYVRGMFDGNGSIVRGKMSGNWSWHYTGSMNTCEFLKGVLADLGVSCYIGRGVGCFQLKVKSTEGTMKMQRFMHDGCTGPAMARKAIFEPSEHLWSESGRVIPKSFGTEYEKDRNRYRVVIIVDGKKVRLGRHRTRGLAYSAYAKDSLMRYGRKSPFWKNVIGATVPEPTRKAVVLEAPVQPPTPAPTVPSWKAKLEQQLRDYPSRKAPITSFGTKREE